MTTVVYDFQQGVLLLPITLLPRTGIEPIP